MNNHDHISDEEILKDIEDTKSEISTMRIEIKAFEMLGDRLSHMKADRRKAGIESRHEFIKKLEAILADRQQKEQ